MSKSTSVSTTPFPNFLPSLSRNTGTRRLWFLKERARNGASRSLTTTPTAWLTFCFRGASRRATWSLCSWRTALSTWGSGWAWQRSEWRQLSSTSTWDWRLWCTVPTSPAPKPWCLAVSWQMVRRDSTVISDEETTMKLRLHFYRSSTTVKPCFWRTIYLY